MRIIAVDDNEASLEMLQLQLEQVPSFGEISAFQNPLEALAFVRENRVDMAFLDIIMEEMDGLELARAVRETSPQCKVIFVTSSTEFAMDAFRVHAAGYLEKPVRQEMLLELLEHIGVVPSDSGEQPILLRVQCFGLFEAYTAERVPLSFTRKKTKELLAYLIHRKGAMIGVPELAAVLYENRDDTKSLQSLVRNLISDLKKTLRAAGASECLCHERGRVGVMADRIGCDYYEILKGGGDFSHWYHGEYMSQYPWGDPTTAYLNRQTRKNEES